MPAAPPFEPSRHLSSSVLSRLLILLLLLICGINPNPGPRRNSSSSSTPSLPPIGLLSWNANGLQNSCVELTNFLKSRQVKIACIQETKLSPSSRTPSFPGYAVLRLDRPRGRGGGVITLIHHSISFVQLDSPFNDQTEAIIIKADVFDTSITIANVYIPPQSSCEPNFSASLLPLFVGDYIVVGDINGHDELWSSGAADNRGDAIADEIDSRNAVVLNNPDVFTRPQSSSSPDVAVVPPPLALSLSWGVIPTLNSDHLPMYINYDNDAPPSSPSRTFTNFRKADWDAFKRISEEKFANVQLPSSCSAGEKTWRRIIQQASARSIPSGCRPDFCPGLDADTTRLMKERDEKRNIDPNDPELPDLNRRISFSVRAASRKRWMESVVGADRRTNAPRWWSLLKGLAGKRSFQAPNQPISFNDKVFSNNKHIANEFCKQYANVKPFQPTKESREIFRNLKQNNPLDHSYTPFNTRDAAEAIRRTKNSTAAGPNHITALHLKHIGPRGLAYLTRLFNLSVRDACIPMIWRSANIIPVLKPGKAPGFGQSYRPISLLCPEFKVLERLLLPAFSASLKPNRNQHGFRPDCSTVSTLTPLVTSTARGFNQRKPAARTGVLSIDISKAFDAVRRDLLLKKIAATDLHPNLKRWTAANLVDRRVKVVFHDVISRWRKSKMGVPQGAVLSPLLWNFFTSDLDETGFADDYHKFAVSEDLAQVSSDLQDAADRMVSWAKENDMEISAPKSSVTLLTPWTKQVNATLDVSIDGVPVPMVKNPRLLGVHLDPMFTFSTHASSVAKRASSRLNILRALSASDFGKDKECLLITHKAFLRSVMSYAAPIIYPQLSPSAIKRMQLVQNKSLRLSTGCHLASSVEHLHAEVEELPVDDHLRLLSAQYLARSLQPHHVNFEFASLDQGPRALKDTLRSKCLDDVAPYLEADGTIDRGKFSDILKKIHSDIVRKAVNKAGDNRLIGRKPPPINHNELHLPRISRVTLSQLRSGFCHRLRNFQFKIGKAPDDICQRCFLNADDVPHLFDCPAHPTTLFVEDLWNNPWGVADFVRRLPGFDDLPPPQPPPPPRRRPPQRPPPLPPDSPIFTPLSLPDFLSPPPSPLSPNSFGSSFSLFSSPPNSPLPLMSFNLSPPASPSQDPRYAGSD